MANKAVSPPKSAVHITLLSALKIVPCANHSCILSGKYILLKCIGGILMKLRDKVKCYFEILAFRQGNGCLSC